MAKRQSLTHQMRLIMTKQAKYIGTKRHDHKAESGHAQYDKLTSISSYETHVARLKRFKTYLADEGVRNVADIHTYHVEEYLHYMKAQGFKIDPERGYSHAYLANTLTSINHLLINEEGHMPYRCSDFDVQGYTGRKNNLDGLERPEIPGKYDQQVELAQAFGLRRHEIELVNTKSFYELDGCLYATIIGKNGRPRVAEVRADHYRQMKERYTDYIRRVESSENIPSTKAAIQRSHAGAKTIHPGAVPSKYSLHIFRSEYANELFHQIIKTGDYEASGQFHTINGVRADRAVFERLTQNLGHNRLYVLESYLGFK